MKGHNSWHHERAYSQPRGMGCGGRVGNSGAGYRLPTEAYDISEWMGNFETRWWRYVVSEYQPVKPPRAIPPTLPA